MLFQSTGLQAFIEKGHTVTQLAPVEYDVIIGPQCWRIDPAMGDTEKLLELMLKGVRAVKYPKAPSNSSSENHTPLVS